ncbi:MAG: peptidoglycan-binding protein, partial [Eubacteriales bacterium]|nr:peptidoglycan-binding protein [Eubacteriales bacterium]
MYRKNRMIAAAAVLTAMLAVTACGGSEADISEGTSSGSSETVAMIEVDDEAETEPIIRMNMDGEILPVLEDVTTAADNAVLAPAYLKAGDEHQVVMQLQSRLMALGYMDNDEPTAYYGNATAEAVKYFQRQQGMTQDGICGVETWDKLFSADAPYYKVSNGDDGQDIVQIQQRLYQLGYLTDDSTTGHFGDATEAAVRKMQERNGIGIDGAVGKETLNLLYSDEVKANLIGIGEKSDLVKHYQERLIALGYMRSSDAADGNFGGATENAVREFQSRNDQIVDGYLGPDTRAAMDSPEARPFGLRVGDSSASVTTVQKRLNHYGYLASRLITGYYGSATEAAVKQFQKYNDLAQDGTVGILTMTKLESSNAKKKPANVAAASS